MTGDRGTADDELLAQSPSRRWWYLLPAAALVAIIVVAVTQRGSDKPKARATSTPTPSRPSPHPRPRPAASRPVVVGFGHPVPGLTGTVYARAANAVIRLDFARGSAVRTPIPTLQSTGPVTFLATSRGAVVRPIDAVPGYLVPDDDSPARQLDGVLARAAVLPGPRPDQVWVDYETGGRREAMELTDTSDHGLRRLTLPRDTYGPASPDGSGYLLVETQRGLLDVRPGKSTVVAGPSHLNDPVLAAGADRLVTTRCPRSKAYVPDGRCPAVLVSELTGRARPLGTLATSSSVGVIDPRGETALVYQPGSPGQTVARLIDLSTGRARGGPIAVDPDVMPGAAAFSPDGRWLFLVAAGTTLVVVDAATGQVHGLGPQPNIYQVAVRVG